jgi:NitT/TauT family transport system ATP-binding protein
VFLSDRVVVMSPRPGRITASIAVNLPARDEVVRQSEDYFAAVTEVRRALRGGNTPVPRTGEADRAAPEPDAPDGLSTADQAARP